MLNSVKKVQVVEVSVVEVPKKLKLRPWVKLAGLALAVGTIAGVIVDKATVTPDELAHEVKWVQVDAQPGDGYERLVRSVNGDKKLDIKAMAELMMNKNHDANIIAYHSYKAPVLEVK